MGKRKHRSAAKLDLAQNSKRWNPEFSKDRDFADRLFLDTLHEQGNELGPLPAFLQFGQSLVPSFQSECVETFFAETQANLPSVLPVERAWVDNRKKSNALSTGCHKLLTSAQIREKLQQPACIRVPEQKFSMANLVSGLERPSRRTSVVL
jgi:hypothetical protein